MDFPGGAVVENPPCNSEDTGSTPGQGTKIPHAAGQLGPVPQLERENLHATTREQPTRCNKEPTCHKEKILHAATKT